MIGSRVYKAAATIISSSRSRSSNCSRVFARWCAANPARPGRPHSSRAILVLDLLSRRATRAGRKLDLQAREFALLEYLMRNVGRLVTKTMILSHVWDLQL